MHQFYNRSCTQHKISTHIRHLKLKTIYHLAELYMFILLDMLNFQALRE